MTNSVTLSVERSCTERSICSFIRSAAASRLSRRCLAPVFLAPLAVSRARVSFTCFDTSSSLTSGTNDGLAVLLAVTPPLARTGLVGCGFAALGAAAVGTALAARPLAAGSAGAALTAAALCLADVDLLFLERRLRLCLPPGTKPETSIVPRTCGPVRVTVGRKMLSLGASGFASAAVRGLGGAAGFPTGAVPTTGFAAGVAGAS